MDSNVITNLRRVHIEPKHLPLLYHQKNRDRRIQITIQKSRQWLNTFKIKTKFWNSLFFYISNCIGMPSSPPSSSQSSRTSWTRRPVVFAWSINQSAFTIYQGRRPGILRVHGLVEGRWREVSSISTRSYTVLCAHFSLIIEYLCDRGDR